MGTAMLESVTPAMDADEEAALLEAIDRWVQKEVRPVVMKHDHDDIWPAELVAQMAGMGLFGATIGRDYGGLGLPATTTRSPGWKPDVILSRSANPVGTPVTSDGSSRL